MRSIIETSATDKNKGIVQVRKLALFLNVDCNQLINKAREINIKIMTSSSTINIKQACLIKKALFN